MDAIQQEFQVTFRYPVYFTSGVFEPSNPLLRDLIAAHADGLPAKAIFVVDRGVLRGRRAFVKSVESYCLQHGEILRLAAPVLTVPGGEKIKNDSTALHQVQQAIHEARLCRHSYVVAIGGGAVLDVVGYAAAVAHRGVRLIRVPTTVLAQDDSGVGVKNGINAYGHQKNYLGTFAPPAAVINDSSFLPSLPDRDWRGGISEAIKVALIKDAPFFDFVERNACKLAARDLATMEKVVRRSAELHLAHIATSGDPFELGSARPLDFGHWAAHKLERLTHFRLRHGEAVAIGLALDCTYSYLSGFLSEREWRRILDLFTTLGLALHVPELSRHAGDERHPQSVFRGLDEFREHLGGRLTILLLRSIGQAFEVHEVSRDIMLLSIGLLRDRRRVVRAASVLQS